MGAPVVRIGVCGLGRGFLLTAPALLSDPRVRLVAAAEPRPEARARFEAEIGGRTYPDIEALCEDPEADLIYIASPHALHAAQAITAARAGKHVLVEKPMALELTHAARMIAAALEAGVRLIVGPSHGFDAPVLLARRLIAAGDYGTPRMITALNYTDFVYRPRRPDELDPRLGGGAVLNQASHQVDIVRVLMGEAIRGVRAVVGDWDEARATEGAYSALLTFAGGGAASLAYSGYGRFDSDEFCGWVGETGAPKDPLAPRRSLRTLLESAASEGEQRRGRSYGEAGLEASHASPGVHEHFGLVIVSCERADLRLTPEGVWVYGDGSPRLHRPEPSAHPRTTVVDEIWGAVVEGREPLHSGAWGMATLEACLAIRESSRLGREIIMEEARRGEA
ncbi:MAG: 4,5-dihydroxyphthalate dehydrogenase [Caulobacteraceae bacterium]|nr:4,5-dihydroxyphthalate dehydrogenase [Caulobacteraceae bacterium]